MTSTRDMGRLLGSLYPTTGFQSGPGAYINLNNLANGYVLADALGEHGAIRLSEDLSSFIRGVEREEKYLDYHGRPAGFKPALPRKRGVTTPSWERWKDLRKRIDHAIADISEGANFHHESLAPYVRFDARRVGLNRGGYDSRGKYWGVGQGLFRVSADLTPAIAQYVAEHARDSHYRTIHPNALYGKTLFIDEFVRADNAKEAREQIARRLGLRSRRRV